MQLRVICSIPDLSGKEFLKRFLSGYLALNEYLTHVISEESNVLIFSYPKMKWSAVFLRNFYIHLPECKLL